jgi:uncharacterized protein (DUF2126 family)
MLLLNVADIPPLIDFEALAALLAAAEAAAEAEAALLAAAEAEAAAALTVELTRLNFLELFLCPLECLLLAIYIYSL